MPAKQEYTLTVMKYLMACTKKLKQKTDNSNRWMKTPRSQLIYTEIKVNYSRERGNKPAVMQEYPHCAEIK